MSIGATTGRPAPGRRRAAARALDTDTSPILVVGREDAGRSLPGEILAAEGFPVDHAASVPEAVDALRARDVVLVVIDVVDPEGWCGDVVRRVREVTDAPIITLVPSEESMELTCLEMGADDCLLKPVSPKELVIRARLRIAGSPGRPRVLRYDGITVSLTARQVWVDDETVDLTPREYELIAFLASSPRVAFSKDQILERVWGSCRDWQDPRTVTEHVYRLRRKLETNGHEWIVTVPGAGYRFDP